MRVSAITSTRDKLLDSAAQLFLDQGYAATSMDQVRQAAGASNGSLYHHFPTKSLLADALYVQTLHDFHGALFVPISRDAPAESGVKGLVRAHMNWVINNPGRAALLHKLRREGEVTDASADVSSTNAEAFGTLRAWVDRKTQAGEMRALPFYLWMSLVFAPAMSMTARWTKEPNANVPPKIRAAFEHAAWMAVAP